MDRISKRRTTWNLINIKARREQNVNHYVSAFKKLYEEDPLINLPRDKSESLKSMSFSEELDGKNNPKWVTATLLYYTIVDPDAFYNKDIQEDVNIDDWNSDVVANKKESELIFIPSVHTLVVKRNSSISLNNIVTYLSEALNRVEPEMFDISVVVEHDMIDKIINAYAVYNIEAKISFSNPGHTDGFIAAFDEKLNDMQPDEFTVSAKGSKERPLTNGEDGLLQSIVNLSEREGTVKATIESTEGAKLENVDSKDHPRVLVLPQIINNVYSTLYNTIKTIFPN